MLRGDDDPITLRMLVKDRGGVSEVIVEGVNFLEAKKRFLSYLDYIYRDEKYVSITLEVINKFSKTKRVFERISYNDAKDKIIDFLKYAYNIESFTDTEEYYYKYPEYDYYDEIKDIKGDIRDIKSDIKDIKEEMEDFEVESESEDKSRQKLFAPWLRKYNLKNLSIKDKVFLLLKYNHPNEWVRSQDLKIEYEFIYREKIKLSSLSTYLARFYEEGLLERRGSRAQREYRLITEKANAVKI